MRSFREFMMRVSIEMPVKIRRKIRCGIGAEGDDSSAPIPDSPYVPELYIANRETIARSCDCY